MLKKPGCKRKEQDIYFDEMRLNAITKHTKEISIQISIQLPGVQSCCCCCCRLMLDGVVSLTPELSSDILLLVAGVRKTWLLLLVALLLRQVLYYASNTVTAGSLLDLPLCYNGYNIGMDFFFFFTLEMCVRDWGG